MLNPDSNRKAFRQQHLSHDTMRIPRIPALSQPLLQLGIFRRTRLRKRRCDKEKTEETRGSSKAQGADLHLENVYRTLPYGSNYKLLCCCRLRFHQFEMLPFRFLLARAFLQVGKLLYPLLNFALALRP